MESNSAVTRLGALANRSRLAAFRLLVRAGHEGLPAGEIARAVDIPANTLSAHLTVLSHAGLVRSRREGRSVIYTAVFEAMAELLLFLTQDCCHGNPAICAPLADAAHQACC